MLINDIIIMLLLSFFITYPLTGMTGLSDCSVISLKHGDLCMLQSSDYLYPLIDDPYMMVCAMFLF